MPTDTSTLRYTMTDTSAADTSVVDGAFVARYTHRDTLAFFRSLGGTERVTRRNGVVRVVSTPPAGGDIPARVVTFTPLP